jgi:hypothetical protein
MANQVIVTSNNTVQVSVEPTPNVEVTISRTAVGTIANVPTANYANFAGNVVNAAQPNITSVGNLTNLNVTNTITTGNLVVSGNLQVGNLVANTANYANFAGTANTANSATVANSANSVTLANVSGAGNIAGINLDGNVSNLLTGNGTFVAIPTVSANANYANFAGDVVNSAQPNITSTGNLTSFIVNDGINANTLQFNPAGITIGSNSYAEVQYANGAQAKDAYILGDATNVNNFYYKDWISGDGNTILTLPSATMQVALGAADPGNVAATGEFTFAYYTNDSNLTSGATNTKTSLGLGQSLNFVTTMPASSNVGTLQTFSYGLSADPASSTLMRSVRRRGNSGTRLSLEPNDYLGNIEWRGARGGGSLPTGGRYAKIAPRVDSSYVANSSTQPVGIEFWVTDNTTARSQVFHANGNVTFSNAVNANIMTANYLYGDGSNITGISGGSAAGNTTEVQFNNAGAFAASPTFTFNTGANLLTVGGRVNAVTGAYTGDAGGAVITNIDNVVNCPDIAFNRHDNNAYVNNYSVYRTRGTVASPTSVNSGDSLFQISTSAYSNVGYEYAAAGSYSMLVDTNDGAGNITVTSSYNAAVPVGSTFNINYGTTNLGNLVNANYFSGDGDLLSNINGSNVTGTVANATFALDAGNANIANIAYSIDAANVSGLGNIATINLDGNASNLLDGTGNFVAIPTSTANANYANFAGDVVNSAQPNITSVGNLSALTVTGALTSNAITWSNVITYNGNIAVADKMLIQSDLPGVTQVRNFGIRAGNITNASASNTAAGGMLVQGGAAVSTDAGNAFIARGGIMVMFGGQAQSANGAAFSGGCQLSVGTASSNNANATAGVLNLTGGGATAINGNAFVPNSAIGFALANATNGNAFGNTLTIQGANVRTVTSGNAQGGNVTISGGPARSENGNATSGNVNITTGSATANVTAGTATVGSININTGTMNGITAQVAGNINIGISGALDSINIGRVSSPVNMPGNLNVNIANANIVTANFLSGNGGNISNIQAANVVGLGNIATINLDGSSSNVLYGNGVFAAVGGSTPSSIQNGNSTVQFTGPDGALLISTNNVTNGVQVGGRQLSLNGIGEQPPANGVSSQLNVTNGAVSVSQDNIGGGLATFSFTEYQNTTSFLNPYTFYRARGNASSPQAIANGDAVMNQAFFCYGDSGNTYVSVGSFFATILTNDGAGNVSSQVSLTTANNDDGSTVSLASDIVRLDGNSSIALNAAAINLNGNAQIGGTNTFMQLSVYTASALTAITGQIGQIAIVSDSAGGGNPNGMMAFWDTTNSQWSYVHDNSAV